MGLLRNRRLRRRPLRQSSPSGDEWKLSHFQITDDNITTMRRYLAKPRDCVINSMELMNIVDSRTSAIMRILIGDIGITIDQALAILEFVYVRPFRKYHIEIKNLHILFDILNNDIIFPRTRAIFAALIYSNGDGHMITIGKSLNGELVYLDPQNPNTCDLNLFECKLSIFKYVTDIYMIEYTEPHSLNAAAPEPMTDI